jgi:putative ABC transport system permease protein
LRSWHARFFQRELSAGSRQLVLFVLCVFLASLSLSVVSGWRHSVDKALAEETKKGAGGDVVAFSTEPFSQDILAAAEGYNHFLTSEMFTVTLALRTDLTLFTKLKAVEPGYPYYGEVPLQSGRDIHEALKEGLVVEKRALERLEIKVGDEVKIGDRVFPIADMALSEPDRPLGMWGVSPRIFIAFQDLDSTGLIRAGSYLERRIHIKLDDPGRASEVAEELRQVAVPDQERVETWERPPVNMEKYVKNFFTFLDMMVVLAVALGGLGMKSTLSAWLRSRTMTVAITRTLGASTRFVLFHYSLIVFFSGVVGYLLGLAAAAYLLLGSGRYLTQMLPVKVAPVLSFGAALESAFLCFLVSLAFAAWPLYETSQIRPGAVLRQDTFRASRLTRLAFALILGCSLFGLLLFLVADLEKAAYISLILSGVAVLTGVCSTVMVRFLKSRKPKALALRTALGSWRSPEAKSELVVFIISTCLAVLFTAVLCEQALRQSWLEAMPPDSPNLIFLDIQPDQLEDFKKAVDAPLEIFANMRVRVLEINGKPLDRSGKREYWSRDGRGKMDANPTRELPENDTLVEGDSLYDGDGLEQVSIREDMAEALKVTIGDRLTFGVQGVPVTATISSVRKSSRKGFRPKFELLFPPELVEGAPRTIFASVRLPDEEIGPLQTKLAKVFPGVVSMDLSLTIRLIAERLIQMVGLVQYFLWSGIVAGVLILISATWSARQRRARESAYYKVMGANIGFLNRVIWLENLVLGFTCSGLGLVMALAVSSILCSWRLKVPFPETGGILPLMFFIPGIAVALLGWLVGRKVVFSKPAPYLQEG